MTKFYTFHQNNSGGFFHVTDDLDAAVIIEANSEAEAREKMEEMTEGYDDYCECCGPRWSFWSIDEEDEPLVFGDKPDDAWWASVTHYADGTKSRSKGAR